MINFFEKMMFEPRWYHYILILVLMPLSIVYGLLMFFRRLLIKKRSFNIPIVSIGNLIVGGSGKTPFVITLASRYDDVTVISRGYGRKSRGLVEVSRNGVLLCSVKQSGDEAMLMALSLSNASVIVSEDRKKAIALAKERGSTLILLDDGFNRMEIEKFEIILEPEKIKNYLPFPSGAFREFWFMNKYANIVAKENIEFTREVSFENLTDRMVLLTAISNPQRLDKYLPEKNIVKKVYLEDHAYFDEEFIEKLFIENRATSILCTSKDMVKMKNFKFNISEMKLKLCINNSIFEKVDKYIMGKHIFN